MLEHWHYLLVTGYEFNFKADKYECLYVYFVYHNTNPIFDVTINIANLPFDYFPLDENLLKSALTSSVLSGVWSIVLT